MYGDQYQNLYSDYRDVITWKGIHITGPFLGESVGHHYNRASYVELCLSFVLSGINRWTNSPVHSDLRRHHDRVMLL